MRPTVVVSGASRGLGQAICLDLAQDFKVVGFSRGPAGLADEVPRTHKHISGVDANDMLSWQPIMDDLAIADVLINNAAIAYDGLLATQSHEDLSEVIETNLTSVLRLTKEYLRLRMSRRGSGVVINISSIIGIRGYAGLAAYSASKAGMDAVTRSLAREMGPRGFRFNSVLPGYFESDLSHSMSDMQRDQIVRRTPLGRLATTEDITPLIRFLISDEARFITGQSIVVDGGITV